MDSSKEWQPSLSTELQSETCGTVMQESDDDLQENQKLEEEKQMKNLELKCPIQAEQLYQDEVKDGHRPTRLQQKLCQGCLKYVEQLVAMINKLEENKQIINKKETENWNLKMVFLYDKCNNLPIQTQEMAGNGNVDSQDGKDETKVNNQGLLNDALPALDNSMSSLQIDATPQEDIEDGNKEENGNRSMINEDEVKDGHRHSRFRQQKLHDCQRCLKYVKQLVALKNQIEEKKQIINEKETENRSLEMFFLEHKCYNVPKQTQEMAGNGNVDSQDGKGETKRPNQLPEIEDKTYIPKQKWDELLKTFVEASHEANKQISVLAIENGTLKKQLKKMSEKKQSTIVDYMTKYARELLTCQRNKDDGQNMEDCSYPEKGLVNN